MARNLVELNSSTSNNLIPNGDTSITLPAPAKLNLFLHITGRREDGYHLLQTVFQLLDYGDQIKLELRQDDEINRLNGLKDIPASSDLCIKAAILLKDYIKKEYSKNVSGVDISIEKVLPVGGGIGGGSSDAATVLHGLNELWQSNLTLDELATIGLQLGADVPVFVRGLSAWAEGIGEQLEPINLKEKWFLVIHPGVSVSTAQIFLDEGLTRDCEPIKIARFLQEQGSEDYYNVFEPIVRKKHPEVANALDWLSNFSPSRLTGSGSCLFASFDSKSEASSVLNRMLASKNPATEKWQGFVAKGVNKSPLLAKPLKVNT